MADKKISQLTALSAANLAPSTDVLAIVDTSATETKKIAAQDIVNGVLNVASAVGIGTASPASTLEAYKPVDVASASNQNVLTLTTVDSTGGYYYAGLGAGVAFRSGKTSATVFNPVVMGAIYGANSSDESVDNGYLTFHTRASGTVAERMLLNSSGNLGLGVTPSAWSQGRAIELINPGYGIWNGSGSPASMYMLANAYFNSGFKYGGTGQASHYYQYLGQHIWSTAASGTAGNPISFTQAMALATGASNDRTNLLIGTTTSAYETASRGLIEVNGSSTALIAIKSGDTARGYFAASSTVTELAAVGASQPLLFTTNSGERGRFTAGGYFKASNAGTYVGSTGSYHELITSTGSATPTVYIRSTAASGPQGIDLSYSAASPNGTGNEFLYCQDSTAARATIRSNGGLANYQGNDVNLSDERVKTDIAPLGSMWAKFKALEIVTFKYKDQTHDDDNIGVIAQQVESVAPEFIDVDGFGETPEDGVPLKTVYTTDMYHAAIKALQEAMARIEQLEADMAALKASA